MHGTERVMQHSSVALWIEILKWPYLSEKYEPTYFKNFQALEQTCRLRTLSGFGEKHLFFSSSLLLKSVVYYILVRGHFSAYTFCVQLCTPMRRINERRTY